MDIQHQFRWGTSTVRTVPPGPPPSGWFSSSGWSTPLDRWCSGPGWISSDFWHTGIQENQIHPMRTIISLQNHTDTDLLYQRFSLVFIFVNRSAKFTARTTTFRSNGKLSAFSLKAETTVSVMKEFFVWRDITRQSRIHSSGCPVAGSLLPYNRSHWKPPMHVSWEIYILYTSMALVILKYNTREK